MLTKSDKCNDQKKLEKKKKDIAEEISIDVKKILICKNYHEGQNPDSRDVEILEFLTKVHKSRFESIFFYKFDHFKFRLNNFFFELVIHNKLSYKHVI